MDPTHMHINKGKELSIISIISIMEVQGKSKMRLIFAEA